MIPWFTPLLACRITQLSIEPPIVLHDFDWHPYEWLLWQHMNNRILRLVDYRLQILFEYPTCVPLKCFAIIFQRFVMVAMF
jgi:hypothetical protein